MIRKIHTTNIKGKKNNSPKPKDICVSILSAGVGARIKSYEPRSLLKIRERALIDHQITAINGYINDPEIICVIGYEAQRVIKRVKDNARIVENQLFDSTNNSESMRLALNNTHKSGILFIHGDLLFNSETLMADYNKSFVIIDTNNQMEKKEVGLTIDDSGCVSIFSYGLECKWGQIVYITGKELRLAKQIFSRFEPQHKKMLSFEILNKIIEQGGSFKCYEPEGMKILEIDKIRKNT